MGVGVAGDFGGVEVGGAEGWGPGGGGFPGEVGGVFAVARGGVGAGFVAEAGGGAPFGVGGEAVEGAFGDEAGGLLVFREPFAEGGGLGPGDACDGVIGGGDVGGFVCPGLLGVLEEGLIETGGDFGFGQERFDAGDGEEGHAEAVGVGFTGLGGGEGRRVGSGS